MFFEPASCLTGELEPPPDKSISHRAALLSGMCDGEVLIRNYLSSADTSSTLKALVRLGVQIRQRNGEVIVRGVGLWGPRETAFTIDVGNAGTLLRLLPGWLAGQNRAKWTLDGDESIRRRPVDRIAEPLRQMGAGIECREGRLPPLTVTGATLRGTHYELPVASAQVKSCVLLAGLLASGTTTVVERHPSRDHTELMLREAGVPLNVDRVDGATTITVERMDELHLDEIDVPGDFSSAAFFLVAAALVPDAQVLLRGVGVNPTRTGLLDVMERMGAPVDLRDRRTSGSEEVADIAVGHATLRATVVEPGEVPLMIDELPLVALLGAFANGETVVRGAEELRHKESDRIATVVDGLRNLGAEIEARSDGFAVQGTGELRGGTIDSAADHRLAMLGAVAGLASRDGVEVRGFEAADVSYPGFLNDLRSVTDG